MPDAALPPQSDADVEPAAEADPDVRADAGAGDGAGDHHWLPHPEIDLMKLAAALRNAIVVAPDEETRERLESAWVSLTNAIKQPKSDAARLRRRLRRLRGELDQLLRRSDSVADTDAELAASGGHSDAADFDQMHGNGMADGQATRREDQ